MQRLATLTLTLALAGVDIRAEVVTDSNIVTAFDISDSVPAAETHRQLASLAAAVRSPELLTAIRHGECGRIGFAVFAWHYYQVAIVPWTLITSREDAERVASIVERRIAATDDVDVRRLTYVGRVTDVSRAIDHAVALLDAAPFAGRHEVINIISNGVDNSGDAAGPARDRALARGATLNAVVFDADDALLDYFRGQVVGGAGAFLIAGDVPPTLGELMLRKLLRDLIASAEPGTVR